MLYSMLSTLCTVVLVPNTYLYQSYTALIIRNILVFNIDPKNLNKRWSYIEILAGLIFKILFQPIQWSTLESLETYVLIISILFIFILCAFIKQNLPQSPGFHRLRIEQKLLKNSAIRMLALKAVQVLLKPFLP